jgi:hypothetical protein
LNIVEPDIQVIESAAGLSLGSEQASVAASHFEKEAEDE